MVDQKTTLDRLRKERDYEEKISKDLIDYFIFSLDYIKNLNEGEKEIIKKYLDIIYVESLRHKFAFEKLIHMVINNGEKDY
jgi:hypothetical protein